MNLYKCKMCGGELTIDSIQTVCECEYCGSKQTLPKLNDEKRANMYDRASHFRRNNDYDKAMSIYEQILNEDGTDAEAYWSVVLCRYGIEYVEEGTGHKRVPTVNRTQLTSILADEDYKSALKYADASQREIYEAEAKAIEEIQKGIIEISNNEEPFDIFICYKESDNNGRRTHDSVYANDLYHQLTQEGFKVFYARITLEDKLGTAYEPYIFAALNSAKVMVVIGTKKEYFEAPWVKNEWSRYLSLIKKGAKKVLIPAYKDMDPYELPDEFSHLQAQDMSKLGFMQDLIRGVKKIVTKEAPKAEVPREIQRDVFQNTGGAILSVERLLQNAETYLRLGKSDTAYEVYTEATRYYPEDYRGWWGLIRACTEDLKVTDYDSIRNKDEINEWFRYVKELSTAEVTQEKVNLYRDFWEKISESQVYIERRKVDKIILKSQRKLQELNSQLESNRMEECQRLKAFQDRDAIHKKNVDGNEALIERTQAQIAKKRLFNKVGLITLLGGIIVGAIISSISPEFGIFIACACSMGGIVILAIASNQGDISQKMGEIYQYKNRVDVNEAERRKLKSQYEKDLSSIREKNKPLIEKIKQMEYKLDVCNAYNKHGEEEIGSLMFALNCKGIGEQVTFDQGLYDLRQVVFENSDDE